MATPLFAGGTLASRRAEPRLTTHKISRRELLLQLRGIVGVFPLGFSASFASQLLQNPRSPTQEGSPLPQGISAPKPVSDPIQSRFSPAEDAFLEELERASFRFFWEETNPYTGLVKDRSQADGPDARNTASIAATGFGLTALCIAESRSWEDGKKIRERVRNTLRFAATGLSHKNGFFFHFLNMQNGNRDFQSEVSSIDTSIFLCGALACRAYFADAEIRDLATKIYERVDWTWLLQGEKTLSMGWKPESGFLKARWDSYSELMMIYLLGLGSPTHALPEECWDAWKRPRFEFNDLLFIGSHAPLYVHQYSHAWFDFRRKADAYANYFENSVIATKAHKLWCLSLAKQFPDYSEDLWGITASDSTHGYVAWGGPPLMGPVDGSIVPCAAAGSLPFLPGESLRVLQTIREKYAKHAWRKYSFVDAFNPLKNWYNPDVIGIDLGITLLMAENARTGFIWEQFMKNDAAKNGMARVGFHEHSSENLFTESFGSMDDYFSASMSASA
jgi:hypothetical protein